MNVLHLPGQTGTAFFRLTGRGDSKISGAWLPVDITQDPICGQSIKFIL
jgi:hypothetical protein